MSLSTPDDVRELIACTSAVLDPRSRYVTEFLALIEGAATIGEVEARLSGDCRGARHARAAYAKMSLSEKVIANLITPETAPLRFSDAEVEAIGRIARELTVTPLYVLIVPCSRGDEAYSVAYYLSQHRRDYEVHALDTQPALVEYARALPNEDASADWPAHLRAAASSLKPSIRFQTGDAFALPATIGTFDVIFCRNFLGHFVEPVAERCVSSLLERLSPRGVLFLDDFCAAKFPSLAGQIEQRGGRAFADAAAFRIG